MPTKHRSHYRDVFATLYHNMGIDIASTPIPDNFGRPNYLFEDREPIKELA